MKLSIIIVNYNTSQLTLDCIESILREAQNSDFEIIVLDNASSDNSVSAIAEQYPQIQLIESKTNLGFAVGNNVASKSAKGEYFLLLNPDTVVLNHGVDKLFEFAEAWPEEGIFGGRTLDACGNLDPTSCWRRPTLWSLFCFAIGFTRIFSGNRFFDPESYGAWGRDSIREVDIITGCFLLLKKVTWEQLDGFSPEFFMYAEEADLCLRAREAGIKSIFTPNAEIIHYGGASERVQADKLVRMLTSKIKLIEMRWQSSLAVAIGRRLYLLGSFIRAWSPSGGGGTHNRTNNWREVWHRRKEWFQPDRYAPKSD